MTTIERAGPTPAWARPTGRGARAALGVAALVVGACGGRSGGDATPGREGRVDTGTAAVASTPAAARFVYDTAPDAAYVAEIWDTDSASQVPTVAHARGTPPGGAPPGGAPPGRAPRGVLVLRAYNGQRVVRLTRWDAETAASAYAGAARGAAALAGVPRARYVEELRVRSVGHKPDQALTFDTTTAAQFSQFTMRRKAPVDTLQAMAAGMSGGMVQAEPTLRLISTLTARDSSVVAFLGAWTSPKGFDIFAERKTFSAKPYWDPYAGNEHHMMQVVAASTRP